MRKIHDKRNFKRQPIPKDTMPDLTIPDDAYSIPELVRKHKSGNLPPIERHAIWMDHQNHDDLDLSKINDMDITERSEIKDQHLQHLNRLKEQAAAIRPKQADDEGVTEGSAADIKTTEKSVQPTTDEQPVKTG